MAKREYRAQLKRSKTYFALLLVKFFLIKLGQLPFLVADGLWLSVKAIFFLPSKLKFPQIKLRSKRGRPPKSSLISRNYLSFKKYFRKNISKKTKIAWALGIFLIFFLGYTYFTFQAATSLPSPKRLQSFDQPLTTEFFDRNGKLLYRLYEGRNRTLVKLDELPPYLINATIAIEDKHFYIHPGFDPLAMGRALFNNLRGESVQGASTITQQLVKNSLLTPEKTYLRKLKEVFLAFWAERIYTKQEILQMYFNEAPYGGPAWGIEAGAQTYFGKSAGDLNMAEATFLAGLPASPTVYSPFGTQPQKAKERQKEVLRRMVEDKYLSEAQAEEVFNEPLEIQNQLIPIHAPHFVMYVRNFLSQKFGQRVVSQGGLKVTTTLDLGLQEATEKIVKEEVDKLAGLNVKNGAAMVTDAKTGQILSMVGSKNYFEAGFGNFNVTLSQRQPGSSIKPVTYAAAFKLGYSPGNTILDSPVNFKDAWGNSYAPVNYDRKFHGPVSIRTALGSSYNVPAVKMLATVGVDKMIQTAKDLGITTFNDSSRFGLSLTLGGGEVRMIDMMGVYGSFAEGGVLRRPTPLLQVVDSAGNILEEYKDEGQQALQPEIAYLITSILTDNSARTPAFGSNSLLKIADYSVAAKTGTSDNKRDNWTFGYSRDFVVGVWVGNPDNSPMNEALTSGITGAAPIWNKIMKLVLPTVETSKFIRPAGLVEATVDGRKDLVATEILPKTLVRTSKDGDKTVFIDAFSSFATPSAVTQRSADSAI